MLSLRRMAMQHHPKGRVLLQRRTAVRLGTLAYVAYLADTHARGRIMAWLPSADLVKLCFPALAACCAAKKLVRG